MPGIYGYWLWENRTNKYRGYATDFTD